MITIDYSEDRAAKVSICVAKDVRVHFESSSDEAPEDEDTSRKRMKAIVVRYFTFSKWIYL